MQVLIWMIMISDLYGSIHKKSEKAVITGESPKKMLHAFFSIVQSLSVYNSTPSAPSQPCLNFL